MWDCNVSAEKSWKQRNAEAMDMEVSSEEGDEDMPDAQKQKRHQQANDGSSAEHMLRVRSPVSTCECMEAWTLCSTAVFQASVLVAKCSASCWRP